MLKNLISSVWRALALLGALALAYCGWFAFESYLFQRNAENQLEEIVRRNPKPHVKGSKLPSFREGDVIGRLEIPHLRLSVMVIEGDGDRELRLGAGHIPGTAIPGESGNVGIAAHRDTFFRALRQIHRTDLIRLVTSYGLFQYTVAGAQVVKPSDVEVLRGGAGRDLTLVTCYPFEFIGPAPSRFIVRAVRCP